MKVDGGQVVAGVLISVIGVCLIGFLFFGDRPKQERKTEKCDVVGEYMYLWGRMSTRRVILDCETVRASIASETLVVGDKAIYSYTK